MTHARSTHGQRTHRHTHTHTGMSNGLIDLISKMSRDKNIKKLVSGFVNMSMFEHMSANPLLSRNYW